jgi:alpha-L-fucosidase
MVDRSMTYLPTLDSVRTHPLPSWYDEAKLGIFVHWSIYNVPAYAPAGEAFAERMLKGEIGFGSSPYAEWYPNSLRYQFACPRSHAATGKVFAASQSTVTQVSSGLWYGCDVPFQY